METCLIWAIVRVALLISFVSALVSRATLIQAPFKHKPSIHEFMAYGAENPTFPANPRLFGPCEACLVAIVAM